MPQFSRPTPASALIQKARGRPQEISDLPVNEVPAEAKAARMRWRSCSRVMAAGRGFDKELATQLAERRADRGPELPEYF